MTVRLIWIERDLRGNELSRQEQVLYGESKKTPTRNQAAKLIARHHPELISVDKVHLLDSSETIYRWYVKSTQRGPNCWVTVYADPILDVDSSGASQPAIDQHDGDEP